MSALSSLVTFLKGEENALPAPRRKQVYRLVKRASGLVTLALLVLPELPSLGVNWSEQNVALVIATGALTALGQLADPNTSSAPTP